MPFVAVIGDREVAGETLSIRGREGRWTPRSATRSPSWRVAAAATARRRVTLPRRTRSGGCVRPSPACRRTRSERTTVRMISVIVCRALLSSSHARSEWYFELRAQRTVIRAAASLVCRRTRCDMEACIHHHLAEMPAALRSQRWDERSVVTTTRRITNRSTAGLAGAAVRSDRDEQQPGWPRPRTARRRCLAVFTSTANRISRYARTAL